jgi:hypothetical protein
MSAGKRGKGLSARRRIASPLTFYTSHITQHTMMPRLREASWSACSPFVMKMEDGRWRMAKRPTLLRPLAAPKHAKAVNTTHNPQPTTHNLLQHPSPYHSNE